MVFTVIVAGKSPAVRTEEASHTCERPHRANHQTSSLTPQSRLASVEDRWAGLHRTLRAEESQLRPIGAGPPHIKPDWVRPVGHYRTPVTSRRERVEEFRHDGTFPTSENLHSGGSRPLTRHRYQSSRARPRVPGKTEQLVPDSQRANHDQPHYRARAWDKSPSLPEPIQGLDAPSRSISQLSGTRCTGQSETCPGRPSFLRWPKRREQN